MKRNCTTLKSVLEPYVWGRCKYILGLSDTVRLPNMKLVKDWTCLRVLGAGVYTVLERLVRVDRESKYRSDPVIEDTSEAAAFLDLRGHHAALHSGCVGEA